MFLRGHIYRAEMPGERKIRPVVILSPDRRNDRADTVVIVPCTTVPRHGPWNVALKRGEGGLPEASVIKCEEVTQLVKGRLSPTALGGPLSGERMAEIRSAILRALDFE